MIRIETQRFAGRDVRVVTSVLLPPLATLGSQWLAYSLVHQSCVHGNKALLYLIEVAGLAACAVSFALARSVWNEVRHEPDDALVSGRSRFLAVSGQVMGAFFFLVVLAMGIPDVVLRVCD